MTHGSLFSGIGGFDLAAEWMGWENVFHCENNPFGQKILKHYWPNSHSHADITKTDFSIYRGLIDILTGGFPCQPYSLSGERRGTNDPRHLWPHKFRAVREIRPRWIVGENVRGLVSWNGGMVFDQVQADLESEGYEVTPYLLPACSVNAPHRRDRIWFIAYSGHARQKGGAEVVLQNRSESWTKSSSCNLQRTPLQEVSPDSDSNERFQRGMRQAGNVQGNFTCTRNSQKDKPGTWENFPTQPPVCDGNDGLSARLDGITISKWRTESIKGGGNAIVPQVAHQIFKAIEQYQSTLDLTP